MRIWIFIFWLYLIVLVPGFIIANNVVQEKPVTATCVTTFVVYPQDTNANYPMLFGGKILAEMDRCAGVTVRRFLYDSPNGVHDAVTVGINNVSFHKAAQVKDLIIVTGTVQKVGVKIIEVKVVVERETLEEVTRYKQRCDVQIPYTQLEIKRELIAEGVFTYCSYDLKEKKGVPHGITKQYEVK